MKAIHNQLFQHCLSSIPQKEKERFEESFNVAERLSGALNARNISNDSFAKMMNKKKSDIGKWLTGRHHFRKKTIVRIEAVLGVKLQ